MWIAVVALAVLVPVGIFVARFALQSKRGDYRDAEGTERPSWIVGNGRHGGV